MSAFDRYLHTVLLAAQAEARDDGSAAIEARHALLAVAAQDGTEPQRVLAAAGLGPAELKAALDREFAHSLGAAGVAPGAFDLHATPDPDHRPRPGASLRLALDRMAGSHRKKDLTPLHLLHALLAAEVGTVPRALDLAGVDRAALAARVREGL
ncbi:Clp protease N-terminal domain-containing protein [Streptomyces sp. MAR4 CNX-425]|uniref:Clp protease N-terminal domain-containing protein n=1 Tax=Streptomyces sp. MAR4 CNX-425 TaxID=3406343 RepID=UPI003B502B4E